MNGKIVRIVGGFAGSKYWQFKKSIFNQHGQF